MSFLLGRGDGVEGSIAVRQKRSGDRSISTGEKVRASDKTR